MTITTMQSLIRNLQASDVTQAYAVRCGDSLFDNENESLAIFTDHNVIACSYSEFVVLVLNPNLLRNLIRTKKLFSFALNSSPKELKKTFLGIPVFFKSKGRAICLKCDP